MAFRFLIFTLIISSTLLFSPASGQITTPCAPSTITTFTPCMNFVTNSSLSGTAPTSDCCNSLKSLMNNGMSCFCLIVAGGVPFSIPISQTQAIALPSACNMPGVPLQCKAAGSPVSAPGPVANGSAPSPNAASSPTAQARAPPEPISPRSAPKVGAPPSTPTSTGGARTSSTGSRAGVTPSAAYPSYTISHLLLVDVLGAIALDYYSI